MAQGYQQVETPEEAGLVLYNTCSIRDKAEQKVFNRLQQFKREAGKGKVFGVLGLRGAAGRREDLRTRAARQPGGRVGQLHAPGRDAGATRSRQPARHRPEPGYGRDLRHAVHPPRQSAPRLHHHHRRLRQILRLLRGAVHPRAGAQPHQRERHGGSARAGRARLHRDPVAGPEREQLPRSLARRLGFRRAARRAWPKSRASAACATPPRTRAISASASWTPWTPIPCSATTCICRCSPAPRKVLAAMDRLYTRDDYMRRIEWLKTARRPYRHHHRHHRRLSRRNRARFRGDPGPAGRGRSTIRCSASSIRRGPTPPRWRWTTAFRKRRSSGAW